MQATWPMTTFRNDGKDKHRKRRVTRDDVLSVVIEYAREHHGNSPSIRNLHKRMVTLGYDVSKTSIQTHVERLEWRDHKLKRDTDGELVVIGAEWNPPE